MDVEGLRSECRGCRELVQQAREILIQERAFSCEEANGYMYELAQARKLLVVEVANRIIAGEWAWTDVSRDSISTDADQWLGRW
jgi:AmiR/NasT family two-component response regulator